MKEANAKEGPKELLLSLEVLAEGFLVVVPSIVTALLYFGNCKGGTDAKKHWC